MPTLRPNEFCEEITVCGAAKILCVKESESPTNRLDQSLADIAARIEVAYDKPARPVDCD